MTRSRLALIGVLVAILAGLAALDRFVPPPSPSAVLDTAGRAVAAPADALASTWYCAGGTTSPNGPADAQVVVANPSTEPVTGTVTVVPVDGESVRQPLRIEPRSRTVVRPGDVVTSSYAATIVEVYRGEVAVEHGVSGTLGFDLAPCVTSGSTRWYVAAGSTTKASTMLLALFNPFPTTRSST